MTLKLNVEHMFQDVPLISPALINFIFRIKQKSLEFFLLPVLGFVFLINDFFFTDARWNFNVDMLFRVI